MPIRSRISVDVVLMIVCLVLILGLAVYAF
jgi:hypothetical protein